MDFIQWTGKNILDVRRFALKKVWYYKKLYILTKEGKQEVPLGAYVRKDTDGNLSISSHM